MQSKTDLDVKLFMELKMIFCYNVVMWFCCESNSLDLMIFLKGKD